MKDTHFLKGAKINIKSSQIVPIMNPDHFETLDEVEM